MQDGMQSEDGGKTGRDAPTDAPMYLDGSLLPLPEAPDGRPESVQKLGLARVMNR